MASPTLENLSSAIGKQFSVHAQKNSNPTGEALLERSDTIDLRFGGGSVETAALDGPKGTSGLWVTYVTNCATYGIVQPGQTWGASGPFSGCRLVIGKRAGQLYLAHIATPDNLSGPAWRGRGWGDEVWVEFKVAMAEDLGGWPASYVFVDWSRGATAKNLSVFRMDVLVGSMGGTSGTVKRVTQLA